DLARTDIVEAEGAHFGERQAVGKARHVVRWEAGSAREELVDEALQVVFVRIGQETAALEEARRREPHLLAGLFERLRLSLVAVRRIQQFLLQGGHFRRAVEARQPLRPGGDRLLHALFLLDRGERELEGLLRRGLEPTLAAAVEVHRRRMELDQNSRGLHRRGLAPDVVLGELAKPELARTTALPQETDVEILRELLGLGEELRAGGALEGEQHVRRLDLGSAPVRALDLEGGGALAEHRADL